MRTLSSLAAVVSLILTVAFIPIVGGVIFAMVFFGLFLLALVGVLGRARGPHGSPAQPIHEPEGVARRPVGRRLLGGLRGVLR